jgi:hypothetical protein
MKIDVKQFLLGAAVNSLYLIGGIILGMFLVQVVKYIN